MCCKWDWPHTTQCMRWNGNFNEIKIEFWAQKFSHNNRNEKWWCCIAATDWEQDFERNRKEWKRLGAREREREIFIAFALCSFDERTLVGLWCLWRAQPVQRCCHAEHQTKMCILRCATAGNESFSYGFGVHLSFGPSYEQWTNVTFYLFSRPLPRFWLLCIRTGTRSHTIKGIPAAHGREWLQPHPIC